MTNYEKWQLYCRDLFTNRTFVKWGWHALIAGALERRFFYDNEETPQWPNQYTVLIGPAGVGKGMVLDEIRAMLRHHCVSVPSAYSRGQAQSIAAMARYERTGAAPDKQEYMYKLAADSTTFESLLVELANGIVTDPCLHYKSGKVEHIAHSSCTFVLDEFTSVFKAHSEDLLTFLLTAWNCKDYHRKTKKSGHDDLVRICLNLVGGTTPSEFAKLLRKEIVGTGVLGRTMLVYADHNDKRGIKIPARDAEQIKAGNDIKELLKQIKTQYRCITYTPEAEEFLLRWYDSSDFRVNHNGRLDEYYVRKINHLHKLAMARHIGEGNFTTQVPAQTLIDVINFMAENELNMHKAFTYGGRNELSPFPRRISDFVAQKPAGCNMAGLFAEFHTDMNRDELNDAVQNALALGYITFNPQTQNYYATKTTDMSRVFR